MHDPENLNMDLEFSSMFVFDGTYDNVKRPNASIFNTYKLTNIGMNNNEDSNQTINSYLMDGDMLIHKNSELGKTITKKLKTKSNLREKRKIKKKNYFSGTSSRWPLKLVPYEFDLKIQSNQKLQNVILNAISHWTSLTCIKFEPYNANKHRLTHKAKLVFTLVDNGCYSDVGYPDESLISTISTMVSTSVFLSTGCIFGQIVHEIGHAIGFYHEQSRGDRDDYVTIIWSNIIDQLYTGNNFISLGNDIEANNLGIQYDLSSIMHYEATAFGINGSKTIVSKDANLEFLMGNRAGLSFYDIKMACVGYSCTDLCINPPICYNDGFISNNCLCICPNGVTGTNCETFIYKKSTAARLDSLKLDCTFDNDFCDWIQEKYKDEIDFLKVNGPTLAQYYRGNTGPLNDRFNNPNGSYIYFNTYYSKFPGETAVLISPEFYSDTNAACLKFWYNMYTDNTAIIGNLSVFKIDSTSTEDMFLLWTRSGKQSQTKIDWLLGVIDIPVSSFGTRILFRTQRSFSYMGDIAIDDIQVLPYSCSTSPTISVWSNWSSWSSCSVTCGYGTQTRSRTCQKGVNGDCQGIAVDSIACYNGDCVINTPQWSQWYSWSSCSTSCSTGTRTRYRLCMSVTLNVVDNSLCTGSVNNAWQIEYCNVGVTCPIITITTTPTTTTARSSVRIINGNWGQWSPWDNCSLCPFQFDYIIRTRICNNPPPSNGGQYCNGVPYEMKSCYDAPECKVDGSWSSWSNWSSCNNSCGYAVQTRTRTCTNPSPMYLGNNCTGNSLDLRVCTNPNCPINGGFGPWNQWSSCSSTCGQGIRSRTRNCNNPTPAFNGLNCSSLWIETENCSIGNCPTWSNWSPWSDCIAKFCNSIGYIYRTRVCSSSDTTKCVGSSYDSLNCLKDCSDGSSIITTALSTSTTSTTMITTPNTTQQTRRQTTTFQNCISCTNWSTWSECNRNCGPNFLKQLRYRNCNNFDLINGCQIIDYQSCNFNCSFSSSCSTIDDGVCIPQKDGQWSEWEPWSLCSSNCNFGNRTRKRYCNTPEPLNGGSNCIGNDFELSSCDAGPCNSCWSIWSEWSSCTASCGFGWKIRSRKPKTTPCSGSDTEYDSCWNGLCVSPILSSWTLWTSCTKSNCSDNQSVKYRFRTCLNSNNFPNQNCNSQLVDKKQCLDMIASCQNSIQVTTITPTITTTTSKLTLITTQGNLNDLRNSISGWSDWSTWSSCCDDNQVRRRTRVCTGTCLGATSETESCDLYCQYTPWSSCSVSCNPNVNNLYAIGTQSRYKNCNNENCNSILKIDCFAYTACEKNFQWSSWSSWSACNTTCGQNGWQQRSRNCVNIITYIPTLSEFCNGDAIQYNQCNNFSCPQWTNWNQWSSCSTSCGMGIRTRTRNCIDPAQIRCSGQSSETETCQTNSCTPIDGGWSNWTNWTTCNGTCNSGIQTRSRTCTNPIPQYGGKNCTGPDFETINCILPACEIPFQCTFDSSNEPKCQLTILKDSNYNWLPAYMSTTPNSGPWNDHTTGSGRFLYAQGSTAQKFGDKARIESGTLQSSPTGQCLIFWENMNGLTVGNLNVKIIYNNYENLIYSRIGNQGNRWLKSSAYIPANIQYKVLFEAVRGSDITSDIAIDDISINPSSACEILSCDFETLSCDYSDKNSSLLWQRLLNENKNNVLNIDTSIFSNGFRGYFNIPTQNFENNQAICLSFSYQIKNTGTINIYLTKDNKIKYILWSQTFKNNTNWQKEFIDIYSYDGIQTYSTFTVSFEVLRGTTTVGSINLDNISLSKSYCSPIKMSFNLNKNQVKSNNLKKRQIPSSQTCGGIYTLNYGESVVVTSPNYPQNYPLNTECSFIFNNQNNRNLIIQIIDLDLENTKFNLCPDSIEIRYFALGQTGIRICGTLNKSITDNSKNQTSLTYISKSNSAMIYFRSDWLYTRRGFKAQITVN